MWAFSPADDLLATGGNQGNLVRWLHELSPPPPPGRFAMPARGEAAHLGRRRLRGGGRAGERQAAGGSRSVRRPGAVADGPGGGRDGWLDAALALQPTGEQVAVGIKKLNIVSVRDPQMGKELYQLENLSDLWALKYSPDGSLLMVGNNCPAFTKLYDAATGKQLHSFEGKGGLDVGIDRCHEFLGDR